MGTWDDRATFGTLQPRVAMLRVEQVRGRVYVLEETIMYTGSPPPTPTSTPVYPGLMDKRELMRRSIAYASTSSIGRLRLVTIGDIARGATIASNSVDRPCILGRLAPILPGSLPSRGNKLQRFSAIFTFHGLAPYNDCLRVNQFNLSIRMNRAVRVASGVVPPFNDISPAAHNPPATDVK